MPTDLRACANMCCTLNCRGTCTKSWSDGPKVERLAKVLEKLAEQGKLEETVKVLEKSKRTSRRKDDSRPIYCVVWGEFCVQILLKSVPMHDCIDGSSSSAIVFL